MTYGEMRLALRQNETCCDVSTTPILAPLCVLGVLRGVGYTGYHARPR